jgi:hypothetical protein
MDATGLVKTRKRLYRLVAFAIVALVALALMVGVKGRWSIDHYAILYLAITMAAILEWDRSKRILAARVLAHYARSLGLTPSSSDHHVYEGDTDHGGVRVWVVDGPRDQRSGLLLPIIGGLAGTAGSVWMSAGYGLVGIAIVSTVTVVWLAWKTRPALAIEGLCQDGLRRRTQVRGIAEVGPAIATLPAIPPASDLFQLPPGVDVPHLLSRVQLMRDEEGVLGALIALGEAGSPSALGPLVDALRKRPMALSARVAFAAERSAARIRERHGLAEQGALGLIDADERSGRIGIGDDSGALSQSDREK